MTKPSFGVIVGRFQVHELHDGHMELIRTVRGLHNRVIIFLGVSPVLASRRNPLDFITRKRMIQAAFPDVTVLSMPDMVSDDAWSKELDKRIKEVAGIGEVTLYGGRDSFVPVYTGEFKPIELPLHIHKSGEDVRAEVSSTVMASPDFRAGVIYAATNQYPKVVTCVDIAILSNSGKLLLARKPHEKLWRFVGGHAYVNSTSFEDDAYREVQEETGLTLDAGLSYLGSFNIEDWRYKKEIDRVRTIFYIGYNTFGAAQAKDDIDEVHWFDKYEWMKKEFINNIESCHKILFNRLLDRMEIR